jgi:hypothetical protein
MGRRYRSPGPILPDFDRADRIGEFWSYPETRAFAELLIDLEEDKAARAVVFGLLAEMERKVASSRTAEPGGLVSADLNSPPDCCPPPSPQAT